MLSTALLAIVLAGQAPSPSVSEGWKAYEEGRYFDLMQMAPTLDHSAEGRFLKGVVLSGINHNEDSVVQLSAATRGLEGKNKREALENLSSTYVRMGRYRLAALALDQILRECRSVLTEKDIEDLKNGRVLWNGLKGVPPMAVRKTGNSKFFVAKSTGFPLAFSANGRPFQLGADTGADLSLVREGLGKRMGLRMIDVPIRIGSITGDKVTAWLGVADDLIFGKARVKNAVFLVMRDQDLYFPAAKFQLNGVIGLPVLLALGEVTFRKDGYVEIPPRAKPLEKPNLFLAGHKPFIEGSFKGHKLTFAFDSGANTTVLYPPFVNRYRAEVEARGFPKTHRLMGVAGVKETKAYMLTDFAMRFAEREVVWPSIDALTEVRDTSSKRFFGNIGQDMMAGFDSVTFNWDSMRLTLGNRVSP